MKKIQIPLLLMFFTFLAWQCSNNKPASEENTVAYKKHDTVKVIKTLKEYKIGINDTLRGFLLNEEHYNEKGLMVKSTGYSFYGGGDVTSIVEQAYNDQGKCIKYAQTSDGITTTTTYTYDDKGNMTGEAWSRANGEGAKTEYNYKDGRIAEEKKYDEKGKLTSSAVYEYVLDAKGRVAEERKVEKYTDGSADHESYKFINTYYDNDSLQRRKSLRNDGSCCASDVGYKYDAAGNKTESVEYRNDTIEGIEFTWFNQYGEYIADSMWAGNKENFQFSNHYRWDNYGTRVFYLYKHSDGDLWGSRYEVEYY